MFSILMIVSLIIVGLFLKNDYKISKRIKYCTNQNDLEYLLILKRENALLSIMTIILCVVFISILLFFKFAELHYLYALFVSISILTFSILFKLIFDVYKDTKYI